MSLGSTVFGTPLFEALPPGAATHRRTSHIYNILERLEIALDNERGRWFLWLPVLFGCGIAIYLALPTEPPLALAIAGVLVAIPLRIFLRLTALRLIISSVALMLTLGFLDAKLRAMFVDAPSLQRVLKNVLLTGWIEDLSHQDKRVQLTVRLMSLERVPLDAMPRRVRISLRGKAVVDVPPPAGTAVRLRVSLMPPSEPPIPGGFDFARHFWFLGQGASGYGTTKPEVLEGAPAPPLDLRISSAIGNFRQDIGNRVANVLEGSSGAIAQALIMGERGEISKEATLALRNSGLYHVISISGLHMALTAGSAFWLVRAFLALFPALALRFPIKIWAAIGALVIASVYLVISGWALTAVRSYIMIAIMLMAVILNRPALSLRNVAFSALVILAVMPESLTDAGFQMSFAATAALIAFYESGTHLRLPASWPRAIAVPVVSIATAALTAIVAGIAVDPIGAYHFHRIATYSVLGNVMAGPVEALIIMPMALLTLLVMPFGLEAVPLIIMDFGIKTMMAIATFVASLPGASIMVPAFPDVAILLMTTGGLWLLIWRGRWRYWGIAVVGGGLALTPFGERPDIWIGNDGRLVAVRGPKGEMAVANVRGGKYGLERWMESEGDGRPRQELQRSANFQCDNQSCLVMVKGQLVSHVLQPGALADDCARASILIVSFPMQERCTQPRVVVDLADLREKGAHTLKIADDGSISVRTTAETRGTRPWVVRYHRREVIPSVAAETTPVSEGEPP
jgi:competence protein ComEC